ncbi:MAG: hypothetical protein RR744_00900 [Cellulosilyticaceae bacterium]
MFKSKITAFILCLSLFIPCTTAFANPSPTPDPSNPIHINYILNQVEDSLEDTLDKQYKVDWDFDIYYENGVVKLIIEYDAQDAKAFNKISKEQLTELITTISKQITDALGQEVPVEGIIKEDDKTTPTYTFMYKDGKVDIK